MHQITPHSAQTLRPAASGGALNALVQGTGPTVLCLHSSSASHAQWRTLGGILSARWRVVMPDLHGHGGSPGWPEAAGNSLAIDADAAMGLAGDGPLHLVGHSYGGALALHIALRHPQRVASLTLYEPVAFGLLRAGDTQDASALEEIEEVAHSVAALAAEGRWLEAARVFVAYWGGSRSWAGLTEPQRRAVMSRMAVVTRHFEGLFGARFAPDQLSTLQMPVLLLAGSHTRTPARRVAHALARALPHVQCGVVEGAGHLGPITHAHTVGRWMAAHVDPLLAQRTDFPAVHALG